MSSLLNKKIVLILLNFGIAILVCIMVININNDTISAYKYAKSVDDRIESLDKLNKRGLTGIISVNPIIIPYTIDTKYLLYKLIGRKNNPQPVLYYISDTEKAPNEYSYHLQKLYGYNFSIKLRERKK